MSGLFSSCWPSSVVSLTSSASVVPDCWYPPHQLCNTNKPNKWILLSSARRWSSIDTSSRSRTWDGSGGHVNRRAVVRAAQGKQWQPWKYCGARCTHIQGDLAQSQLWAKLRSVGARGLSTSAKPYAPTNAGVHWDGLQGERMIKVGHFLRVRSEQPERSSAVQPVGASQWQTTSDLICFPATQELPVKS